MARIDAVKLLDATDPQNCLNFKLKSDYHPVIAALASLMLFSLTLIVSSRYVEVTSFLQERLQHWTGSMHPAIISFAKHRLCT